jgi:hypothetical protein
MKFLVAQPKSLVTQRQLFKGLFCADVKGFVGRGKHAKGLQRKRAFTNSRLTTQEHY